MSRRMLDVPKYLSAQSLLTLLPAVIVAIILCIVCITPLLSVSMIPIANIHGTLAFGSLESPWPNLLML